MNSPATERRNIVRFRGKTGEIGECVEVTDRLLHPGVERIECVVVVVVVVVTAQHRVERAVECVLRGFLIVCCVGHVFSR